MQKIIVIGNLVRDPETKQTNNGKTVTNFTVAVNRRQKIEGQPEADFFRATAWGQLAENCQKYLCKGKKVAVTGTVSAHAYADKNGNPACSMDIFAQEVEFLSPAGQTANSTETNAAAEPAHDSAAPMPVEPDDLPF